MKKNLLLLFAFLFVVIQKQSYAQGCTNANESFGDATIIKVCSPQQFFAGTGQFKRLILSGAATGDQYIFTSSTATDFLTLRSTSGAFLASGITPLVFTQPAIVEGTVQLHISNNAGCFGNFSSRTLTAALNNNCPPPPSNNDCATAVSLPVNTDNNCTAVLSGNTVNATQSQPGCSGTADDDVWYSFVATAPAHKIAITAAASGGITSPVVQLFSGSCATLTSIRCKGAVNSTTNIFTQGGLTVGNTYFVRVYSSSSSLSAPGAFSICISTPAVVNDNCSGAINLPVNTGGNCPLITNGTTVDATESQPGCSGDADDDVWYSFVATATAHKIELNAATTGGIVFPEVEMFSGSCAGLTSLSCQSPFTSNVIFIQSGLIIGDVYFIRVYSNSISISDQGSFSICVSTLNIPINDNCGNAIPLTVNTDNTCVNSVVGNTSDASQSQTGCAGTADDDIWYSFVASSTSHKIVVAATPVNGIVQPRVELFSGTCAGLTSVRCNSFISNTTNILLQTGLTVGDTYFVRVYSSGSFFSQRGSFTICVNTPVVPANDNCPTAISLAVNADNSCTLITAGTTLDASQSQPGCSGTADDDVWYSFTATATTHRLDIIAAETGGIQSPVMQLFSGNCSTLSSVICNTQTSSTTNVAIVSSLNIGTTYFVRVYSSASSPDAQGAFTICVKLLNIPVNDNCTGAINLPVNPGLVCTNTTTGTTSDATQSQAGCNGTADDDVWYSFVATAAAHKIIVNATATGGIFQPIVQLFSGTCTALTSLKCNVFSSSANNTQVQGGLTIGTTYFVRVYSSTSLLANQGAFTICVSTPNIINDECNGAISLTVNTNEVCTVSATSTSVDASQSQAGCSGTANDDVWFKFVATAKAHRVVVNAGSTGGIKFPTIQMFSGSCVSLISVACQGAGIEANNTLDQTGLIVGDTYFVRVHSAGFSLADDGNFSICVNTLNDDCTEAYLLPVNNDTTCSIITNGNNLFASQSQAGCAGTADDDVWYKFVATSTGHKITVEAAPGSFQQPVIELFSGNCSTLTSLNCQFPTALNSSILLQGDLVIGDTYFIRVYSFTSTPGVRGTFNICVKLPIAGEICGFPIPLVPAANQTANYISSTTVINSTTAATVTCSAPSVNNVWYRFTVSSIHNVIRILPELNSKNIYTSVYRGACGSLVNRICSSRDTALALTDFTVGEQISILVHSDNRLTGNAFKIAVITDVPLNDECTSAVPLTIAANSSTSSLFNTTRGATQSLPACSGSNPANDLWFRLTAGLDSFAIEIDNLRTNDINSQLFVGNCNTLVPVTCQTTNNIITVGNPVFGQTYFLRLYSSDGSPVAYFIKAYVKEAIQKNPLFANSCLFTNQVGNSNFENFDTCPTSFVGNATAGSDFIPAWSFPTTGTSDYLNSCAAFNSAIEVPGNNCFGKQSPRSGQGYAGMFTFNDGIITYREYLQGQLSAPLIAGRRYVVSYYLNLADISENATNKIGVHFSNTKVSADISSNLTLVPQIVSPESQFFSDKYNWVNVAAIFTADQPYNFFTIGNFNDNANTSTIATSDDTLLVNKLVNCIYGNSSYINIDDVSISEINEAAVVNNCNVTLPLTLTDFDAVKQGKTTYLSWKTVYEINTRHFEIERSADGRQFYKIGTVAAGFNTGSTIRSYNLTDAVPLKGTNFYRLKMVDADGRFTYSDVRRLRFDEAGGINVFPNPATDVITISGLESKGALNLFAADGKILLQQNITAQTITINLAGYAKGNYLLQYLVNDKVINKKIVKL